MRQGHAAGEHLLTGELDDFLSCVRSRRPPLVTAAAGRAALALALEINAQIAKLQDGKSVYFLDFGSKFLAPDGTLPKEIMHDFLHPSEAGYKIWADAIEAPLAKLLHP